MLKELFLKELVFLLVLSGVGAGLSGLLPRQHFSAGAKLALAPSFGFAASAALLTTVNFFVPLRGALWFVLVPAALVSLGVAAATARSAGDPTRAPGDWRRIDRIRGSLPSLRDIAQVATVAIVVLTIFNLPLDQRLSPGPIAYGVADAPGYVACIRGFADHRTNKPLGGDLSTAFTPVADSEAWGPGWNLTEKYCYAFKFQHTGSISVPAAFAGGMGWLAWQTLAPFLAVLAAITALGALSAYRVLSGSAGWLGIGPGILAAGAPLFQLSIDGSVGLISGIALMPALVAVGVVAVQAARWRTTILAGVLGAGLQACYPELGAIVVLALGLVLLEKLVTELRRGVRVAAMVRIAGPHLLVAGALAILLAPRATLWSISNLQLTKDAYTATSLPTYHMAPKYVIGWLLQTREFYSFAGVSPDGVEFAALGVILALLLIAVALYGAWRVQTARIIVAVAAAATLQAVYLNRTSGCTYCVDRTMLPVAPLVFVLVAIGLRELALSAGPGRREVAGALAGIAGLAAASSLLQLEQRAERGAYMPPYGLIGMANRVSDYVHGTLQLEGFGQTPLWSWSDVPVTYDAMQEATPHRISMVTAYSDYGGLSYLRPRPFGHPSYTPDYDYVLTRLTGIDSGRPIVARTRTMALERRVATFDAILARGVGVDTYNRDPGGTAWLQAPGQPGGLQTGPLTFWVSARSSARVYLRVTMTPNPGFDPSPAQNGATGRKLSGGRVEMCVPVPGTSAARIATLAIAHLPAGLTPPPTAPYDQAPADEVAPLVVQGVRLDKVRVSTQTCP